MVCITKYYCDKCNKEVSKSDDLFYVESRIEYNHRDFKVSRKSYQLCEQCCAKLGLIKLVLDTDKQILKPEPTEADKLFDIISNMVRDNMQS